MKQFTAISLGGGVQSTTLLHMAAHGEITPMPDVAIFADTMWEPRAVYEHVERLKQSFANGPIQVETVSAGSLRDDILAVCDGETERVSNAPFFTQGKDGKAAPIGRNCTRDYKIAPIRRRLTELVEKKEPGCVELWVGISTDEIERTSNSSVQWIKHRHPLIEKNMTRADCVAWLRKHGYSEPPKSSCIGCPYRSDQSWQEMKRNAPDEFRDACMIDGAIKMLPTDNPAYIHRSLKPLGAANFNDQDDMFTECSGTCMT
jgi:hypothetical protein